MEPERIPLVVLLALPLVVWFVASAVRWVASGELLVVTRHGVIRRVFGPGPAFRLPMAEQDHRLNDEPAEVGITVHARSADGCEVRILAELTVEVTAPSAGQPLIDPVPDVVDRAEKALADVARSAAATATVEVLTARLSDVVDGLNQARGATPPRALVLDVTLHEVDVVMGVTPMARAHG